MQAVLFDVGNTLAHLDYAFLAEQARRFGREATADQVGRADALTRRHGWTGTADWFGGYFGATGVRLGLDPEAARAFAAAARAEHVGRPSGLWDQVDPEAASTLEALGARALRLAVVSNADGRVAAQLRRFGLRAHFEVVVDSALAGVSKPDPRIFQIALGAMGIAAEQAVYIGDIPGVDVAGARAAGMAPVLYDRWDVHPDAPAPRILRLGELPALLSAPVDGTPQ